jgi:hypothetical protein
MSETGESISTEVTEANQVNPEDQQTVGTEVTTPQAEPQQLAEEATAKASRLQQENEKIGKVLQGLGMDPDSDFVDRYCQGLVTQEELHQRLNVGVPAPAPVQQAPEHVPTPMEKLDNLLTRVDKEGATEADFKEAMGTMREYMGNQQQQAQLTNQELLAQQCEKTIVDNLLSDPVHKEMPTDELKQIEQRLFVSSTDALVGAEARKTQHPERYLNPNTYDFYTKQNANDLNKLRSYYEKRGFDKGVATSRGEITPVVPISPSAGSTPVTQPTTRINASNVSSAARQYLANQGKAV